MNGKQIKSLEHRASVAHKAYLEAAALSVSPANMKELALNARRMLQRLEIALRSFEGDKT